MPELRKKKKSEYSGDERDRTNSRILLSKKNNTNQLENDFDPLIDTSNLEQQKVYLELQRQ